MDGLSTVALYAGSIVVAFLAIGLIFARLYQRSSKETSFVRTGLGGQKVIMNGGALVFPVLHEIIPVNMNTLRLEVRRADEQALITRDRMRVDVQGEFYVRVQPTTESIANAAQTLGRRTMEPQALKELVEGKFVDAFRAVAAEMAMIELHEQRVDFVQKVQQVVSEDLLKNGLELESVSLTGLDQTSKKYFNPDNAFDAEGLTKLTESIEERRKRRNEIEQDTELAIQRKNLETEQQHLQLSREQEYARLEQEREIEIRRAEQTTEIARVKAEQKQQAEQAQITTQQQVDQAKLNAKRATEETRIDTEREINEKEIARARIIEAAEIEKQQALELAEQERSIAISEKSKSQSEAEAAASTARAEAVRAKEKVDTVREQEIAERRKQIELTEASQEAERRAIGIKVAAEAQKQAAEDEAEAKRTLAQAEADQQRIITQAAVENEKLTAEATEKRYAVEAAGKRALHEADNLLSAEQVAMQLKLALIKHLPEIIRESVKPMEKIEGIRIMQVDGLNSGNHSQGATQNDSAGNLADQVVNSALRYKAQAPLMDALLKEVGLNGHDIAAVAESIDLTTVKPIPPKGSH